MTSRPEYVRIDNFIKGIIPGDIEETVVYPLIIDALYFPDMFWLINKVGIVVERDSSVVCVSFPYMISHLNRLWFRDEHVLPATEEEYDRCVTYFMEKALRD